MPHPELLQCSKPFKEPPSGWLHRQRRRSDAVRRRQQCRHPLLGKPAKTAALYRSEPQILLMHEQLRLNG